jgi:hypothetical protein
MFGIEQNIGATFALAQGRHPVAPIILHRTDSPNACFRPAQAHRVLVSGGDV